MPKPTTFKVSKRSGPSTEVDFQAPESVDDPRWGELTKDGEDSRQAVNDLAVKALIVQIQSPARDRLPDTEKVQEFVDSYKIGQRSGDGGRRKVALSGDQAKKGKFSKAQLEMLSAAGVDVEGMEEG